MSKPGTRPGTQPQTLASVERFRGRIFTAYADTVALPDGSEVTREFVRHPGAVGVVALDAGDRVALLEQYRHPVGERLWELPAGLLDVRGEPARDAAARELVEEAGLRAGRWEVLLDMLSTPGMSDEAVRVFLARDLTEVQRPPGHAEEADLVLRWVPLADAVAEVMSGAIRNAMAVGGLLAAARVLAGGPARPADAGWPDRPGGGRQP